MSIQVRKSIKAFALVAFAFTLSNTTVNAQATASKTDVSLTRSFNDIDDYLPEDHRSDVVIYKDANFKGGKKALKAYLVENFEYPDEARENGQEGKMVAKFTVDRDGSIISAQIVKSAYASLDAALLEAIESMPNWEPALRYGYPTQSTIVLPFKATLQ